MTHPDDLRRHALIHYAVGTFRATDWVETGCHVGGMLAYYAGIVERAWGCDLDADAIEQARRSAPTNATLRVCDAVQFLASVLADPALERPFFYLDANWREEWTGWREIGLILRSERRCIILINAVAISDHPNFVGRLPTPGDRVESKDFAEFGRREAGEFGRKRIGRILSPKYSTPGPVAGYVLIDASGADLRFRVDEFEDLMP